MALYWALSVSLVDTQGRGPVHWSRVKMCATAAPEPSDAHPGRSCHCHLCCNLCRLLLLLFLLLEEKMSCKTEWAKSESRSLRAVRGQIQRSQSRLPQSKARDTRQGAFYSAGHSPYSETFQITLDYRQSPPAPWHVGKSGIG